MSEMQNPHTQVQCETCTERDTVGWNNIFPTHSEKQTTAAMLHFQSIMHVCYCPYEWVRHSVILLSTVAVQSASKSGRRVVFPEMLLRGA